MFTKNCYRVIELRLGASTMFNARLEQACYYHQSVIEELAELLVEWRASNISRKASIPVLLGLGYSSIQISDAIRLNADNLVADSIVYASVEVEVEEEAETE